MIGTIVILSIIIIILLVFIIDYKRDIKYISKQIISSEGQFRNIRMHTLNKEIEDLVLRINELYKTNHNINLKIRKSDEDLRRSIANMSHDLRTPLTSIMGYMQLIEDENIPAEEKKKYLEIIERRTQNLNSLITSFYELSRIESDEYKFKLKAINLNKILCENIALFYNDFVNKNIEPVINIEENVPYIVADENSVMRIFSNLIENMLKHGDKNVIIILKKSGSYIITEFANNSSKLRQEDVAHIFDRFFTADGSRSDSNTGLGLSITKAFVEQMGYKIDAALEGGMLKIKIVWKISNLNK